MSTMVAQMEQSRTKTAVPIVGAWKLRLFGIEKDDGTVIYPFGEEAEGSIIYTESGRYAVQLMRPGRPHFAAGDQMKGTPEEMAASYQGCVSYYGHFDFDEADGYVIHNIEGCLFPNWEGQAHKRFFELSGNRLTLKTPPILWGGGGEVVGVIVWEQVG
ncbi:MAG: lipocalin-like domain-containing protein [Chloroflexi bacterium]|nr:lipocalin-like domain-containing protein [Chloroflexota bacterium]